LNDLEKEFKKAKVNGLDEYANDLEIKINEAKGKISGLLNVKPHDIFPDDKSSRVELKQRAKAIAEAMEEANRVMNLKFEDTQNNKALSNFVEEYKKNLKDIESLEKQISTALSKGEYDYASDLQTRLTSLQQEQAELKESAQALAKYEQAMKNVAEM
jgi:phage shock protein A